MLVGALDRVRRVVGHLGRLLEQLGVMQLGLSGTRNALRAWQPLEQLETARGLGIRAVHHDPASGVAGLRTALGWAP